MKKIFIPLCVILVLYFFVFVFSYIMPSLTNLLVWYFLLKRDISSELSTIEVVLIDFSTHIITYSFIGLLFSFLNLWDKKIMHFSYGFVSEIVSLGLCVFLRFILHYWWIIVVIIAILLVGLIMLLIILSVKNDINIHNE